MNYDLFRILLLFYIIAAIIKLLYLLKCKENNQD